MKRFALTTAAAALVAAPAFADEQATKQINSTGSEVAQDAPLSPEYEAYGTASLIGSEVYTTNLGAGNMDVADDLTMIGSVTDVVLTNAGTLRGIVVDPADAALDGYWFFGQDEIITVNDEDGPRYMISYTADEMAEIERVENPGQFGG